MTPDKMQKRKYSVEKYNPDWVTKFNEIKNLLEGVFGSKALAIEHIGSTSIQGMSAKPVIDVLIVVEKMESFTKEREEMTRFGYEIGDNYIAPNSIIFFKTQNGDRKTQNIHVCVKGSPMGIRFINSRDYFRTHPEKAKQYSDLKEELNKKFPNDYPAYREAKKQFLLEIEKLTEEWYGV